jgi:hypothetical protein
MTKGARDAQDNVTMPGRTEGRRDDRTKRRGEVMIDSCIIAERSGTMKLLNGRRDSASVVVDGQPARDRARWRLLCCMVEDPHQLGILKRLSRKLD